MDTFTNSEDQYEMSQNVAFHKGFHCLRLEAKLIFKESPKILF